MKSLFALLAIAIAVIACSPANELKITNLRVGLVCFQNGSNKGSICFETTKVPITDQGVCEYNRQRHPCTWYGFEFDYAGAQPGAELSCVSTSSHESNVGDPDGIRQQGSQRYEFTLPLENRTGHFFNPQYTLYEPNAPRGLKTSDQTVCSFEGREMFKYQMELQFPS